MDEDNSIDWNQGIEYYYGWIVFICILTPAFILNTLLFLLVSCSAKLKTKQSFIKTNKL